MALTYRRNYTIFNIKKNEIVLNQKLSPFRVVTDVTINTGTLAVSSIKDIKKLQRTYIINSNFKSLNNEIEIFKLDNYDKYCNIFLDENLQLIYDLTNEKKNSIKLSAYRPTDYKPSKLSMKQHKLQKSLSKYTTQL